MELRHLRYFVAVAEEGHITRAAERLGMQQPPLSQQIKALETELGVQLFRRKPRGVEMTEAGRCLLDDARAILARVGQATETARRAARGEQGRLCVGVPPTGPFHPFVPGAIRAFREAFPLVSVTLDECLRTEAIERLQDGRMDVAFLRASIPAPEGLVIHPLLEEPMAVALPSAHSLALSGHGALSMKELAGETFIVYARQHGPAIYEALLAACHRAGFSPRLGQEAPRVTSALGLVAAGFGVSLVPASMRRMGMEGVAYLQLKGAAQPTVALTVASRRADPSPVVRHFLRLVRQRAKDTDATS
ncbi:LysR family transcriptional regulator [Paracraurococcus lichenis]|uniref:LysR family transcriptional regulator n=1 Tax=Paracraurococcus lichenis TaxID=3064888 RepID=A0ABT9E948_9PROT|nr:LysR family transcriptional regulator [Paracraurococcus sp. LOR1-02]MDO9712595.1 LysR family transcriptional regulator [Paracraurococcus sp. LOR1-02]